MPRALDLELWRPREAHYFQVLECGGGQGLLIFNCRCPWRPKKAQSYRIGIVEAQLSILNCGGQTPKAAQGLLVFMFDSEAQRGPGLRTWRPGKSRSSRLRSVVLEISGGPGLSILEAQGGLRIVRQLRSPSAFKGA